MLFPMLSCACQIPPRCERQGAVSTEQHHPYPVHSRQCSTYLTGKKDLSLSQTSNQSHSLTHTVETAAWLYHNANSRACVSQSTQQSVCVCLSVTPNTMCLCVSDGPCDVLSLRAGLTGNSGTALALFSSSMRIHNRHTYKEMVELSVVA